MAAEIKMKPLLLGAVVYTGCSSELKMVAAQMTESCESRDLGMLKKWPSTGQCLNAPAMLSISNQAPYFHTKL